MRRARLLGISIVTGLCACSSQEAPVQPVSWYLSHPTEMQSKVTWCEDDASRALLPDCANAGVAKRRTLLGSQSTLAPIDWGAKPKP